VAPGVRYRADASPPGGGVGPACLLVRDQAARNGALDPLRCSPSSPRSGNRNRGPGVYRVVA
jgi:hypothetical protein